MITGRRLGILLCVWRATPWVPAVIFAPCPLVWPVKSIGPTAREVGIRAGSPCGLVHEAAAFGDGEERPLRDGGGRRTDLTPSVQIPDGSA
jgi:hypothetical protein